MTQNTPKNQKRDQLNAFISKITYKARSQLAEYIITQKLLEQVIDEIDLDDDSDEIIIHNEELQSAIDSFKGLFPQASPLALITAFHNPTATTQLLDSEAIQKFSDSLPDLYALCQSPEAQAITAGQVFYELYHGAGDVSSMVADWFEEFNAFCASDSSDSDSKDTSSPEYIN